MFYFKSLKSKGSEVENSQIFFNDTVGEKSRQIEHVLIDVGEGVEGSVGGLHDHARVQFAPLVHHLIKKMHSNNWFFFVHNLMKKINSITKKLTNKIVNNIKINSIQKFILF